MMGNTNSSQRRYFCSSRQSRKSSIPASPSFISTLSHPAPTPSLQLQGRVTHRSALEHPAARPWSPSPSRNTSAPWTPPPCPASSGFAPVSTSKGPCTRSRATNAACPRATCSKSQPWRCRRSSVRTWARGRRWSCHRPLRPAQLGPGPEGSRDRGLTLQQALGNGCPQPVLCRALGSRALILRPVYEVHAAMDLRRDVVKIPSTLEVDVEDVTAQAQHVRFSQPLLLSELLAMAHVLPAQAEILEGPAGPAVFQSSWVQRLRQGQRLQLHGCSGSWRVLASAPGRRRHFLLTSTYQGWLRMRPRQFTGVQELAAALCPGRALRVVVTQDCEGRGLHVPPLSVGDRLEALGLQGHGPGTRLRCHRHSGEEEEEEEEEEEGEELLLPLDLGGSFVEEARGSRRYGLGELLERRALPCDVRVVAPDPALAQDTLGTLPALRLEARLDLPCLVGSFCEEPEQGFEVPPRWMDCSVLLRQGPVRPAPPCAPVQELTEGFYYRLLAELPRSEALPPPRPPKPAQAGVGPRGKPPLAPRSPGPAPMGACAAPPVLPQRSTSSLCGQRGCPGDADPGTNGSEHEYETIDDAIQKTAHKMQAIFPF